MPFLTRLDKLSLGVMQVDVKTSEAVPTNEFINVTVDGVANIKISSDPELLKRAAETLLGKNRQELVTLVTQVLEGNMREIVGSVGLKEMVQDRQGVAKKITENVVPDMEKLGIEVVNFNIQNFKDGAGTIENMGIDNVEQIRKGAAIAKSNAQREIAVAEAENDKAANDAKVKAATEIAKQQTELAVKKAAMQEQADTAQAKADAAKAIEAEHQRKEHEIAVANANLARHEKEIELKEREVAITERKLEAEIKKKAEADKYAAQQIADAKAYAAQKAAEADLYEREKLAEAARIEAEKKAAADLALATAEAEAQKKLAEAIEAEGKARAAAKQAEGLAEAEAIRAKAEAEAKGMLEKAEALKQYGDAAKQQMELDAIKVLYEQLPAIAEAIGKGYQGANIHVIGNDAGQLAGNMMSGITQITEGFKGATGMDLNSIIGGMLGAKIADNQ